MTRPGSGHKPVARCPMTNSEIRMTIHAPARREAVRFVGSWWRRQRIRKTFDRAWRFRLAPSRGLTSCLVLRAVALLYARSKACRRWLMDSSVRRLPRQPLARAVDARGLVLSPPNFGVLKEMNRAHPRYSERLTYIGNSWRLSWSLPRCRLFVGHQNGTGYLCLGNCPRVGFVQRTSCSGDVRMRGHDCAHLFEDVFVWVFKHVAPSLRPVQKVILLLFQFLKNLVTGEDCPIVDEQIEGIPQRRKDATAVALVPTVDEKTRI
jgi:hypothetical protein